MDSFGERIREARLALRMTQAELARGVATKGFISQVERNRATPSLPKLRILAGRLGLTLDALVGVPQPAEVSYLAKSAELAIKAGEPRRSIELVDEAMPIAASAWEQANLARIRGIALDAMGRWDEALVSHQAAAARAPANDLELNAAIWIEIGTVLQLLEQFGAAVEANLRALDLLDRCKHAEPAWRARVLTNLSADSYALGQMDRSMEYAESALRAATDAESLVRVANAHMALGVLAREAGQLERAIDHCNRALELHRRIGQDQLANRVLNNLGDVHFAAGRMSEARTHQAQSLWRARELGDHQVISITAAELARYALLEGDFETAVPYAREAASAGRAAGDHVREAVALAYEGRALAAQGQDTAADRLFRRAFRLLGARQALAKLAHVCTVYSDVLRGRGEVDRAFAFLQMASERDFGRLNALQRVRRGP
ncbi:MAG TPA: helix-turn-helix transcriptional regulator [Candidatus Limnocylindrales bacterium]|nr:helix-turn-helix transcriptional regulator [Candidatus Limnocylindrales bacterium]